MKILNSKTCMFLAGLALALASAPAAYADDTEIFVSGGGGGGMSPNILFILDTSGSMKGLVTTQESWDPDRVWAGCYDSSAIYWTTGTSTPGCVAGGGGDSDAGSNSNWFFKANFHCDSAAANLRGIGSHTDELLYWYTSSWGNRWRTLSANNTAPVECQNDNGVHGQTAASAEKFVSDGASGPWDTSTNVSYSTNYTMYDGNWLNWNATGGTITRTRLEIVQEVTKNLVDNVNGVNVGLMRFNQTEGGPVIHEIAPVSVSRAAMKAAIDALAPAGYTPLSETMYEAGQYYAGSDVDYGDVGPILSVASSRTGSDINAPTYEPPKLLQCQKNYIVLLSDGEPTNDTSADNKIESLPEFNTLVGPSCDGSGNGACLDDMAQYLYKHDLDGATLSGLQNVTTYTIGFSQSIQSLQDAAAEGGGDYFEADDTASLASTLSSIILDILDTSATFTSPAVPVNAFNRTENFNDVFVSVFEPSGHVHWPGNLKKYKLVNGVLTGQNGIPVVDSVTGFFKENDAWSYWSQTLDGDRVPQGGAADELGDYLSRKLYTNIAGNDLTSAGNAVITTNAGITAALIGAPAAERDNVINWARGLDLLDEDGDGLKTDERDVMGDPLHVRPRTVIYGGTAAAPEGVVFVSTNDGYLHAIDIQDGDEDWAFIPSRLLGDLGNLHVDPLTANKHYGLDGSMSVRIINDDFLPGINPGAGEKVYLVMGMRRGGEGLFAFDVTLRDKPKLLWEIDDTTNAPDFADLGQTWGAASIKKINFNGTDKIVAIFTGGYDTGQDLVGYNTDNVGASIFMVDMETGALIWSAGAAAQHDLRLSRMEHSIPGGVKAIDLSGDGLVNRMYAADMGGRIWRFDINNGATLAADFVDGGMLATLGAADINPQKLVDVRRFYAPPDIVPVISEQTVSYLSLNLGSGHRAHPLDTGTDDYFFSVRDFNIFNSLPTNSPVYADPTEFSDLVDITNDTRPALAASEPGWKLALEVDAGEKVLGESVTFKGTTFFTSFSPTGGTSCVAGAGANRLYKVQVADGSPSRVQDDPAYDDSNPPPKPTRYEDIIMGGIAPGPVLFFTEHDDGNGGLERTPDVCVGIHCEEAGVGDGMQPTFWFQDETQ